MKSQKGISLFLTIIILAIILAIVLGLSAILVGQIKTIKEMGNSVIAFYAADTGVEEILEESFDYIRGEGTNLLPEYDNPDIGNGASYHVDLVCCVYDDTGTPESNPDYNDKCFFTGGETCPAGLTEDNSCKSSFFCIRSVGTFSDTKRAIEVEVFPVD